MKYRLKHVLEYAGLRATAGLADLIPYRAALAVGWIIAWLSFYILRFRTAEARKRIREVLGPACSPTEVNRIAWMSWRNIVFTGMEVLRFSRVSLEWARSVSDCELFLDTLAAHAATGKGAVLACPHMGSWELAAVTCRLGGMPIFSIAARQKNPLVNAYLNQMRSSPGTETLARGDGAAKRILDRLKAGGMLAILPDVRVPRPEMNVFFLGGEANIGRGMAMFAKHAGVPIFPCVVTRRGWTGHRVEIFQPVWPEKDADREADVRRLTTTVLNTFEQAIRREPGQWFWFNKRWILDPVERRGSSGVVE